MNTSRKWLGCCFAFLFSGPGSILAAVTCPVITAQPSDVAAYYCDFVTFHVEATGTPPLQYQWYRGDSSISNATSNVYMTGRHGFALQGSYFVTVQNDGCGAVTSRLARLTVLGDWVPPFVRRSSVPDLNHIFLSFYPCPMEPGTTTEPTNYELSGGAVVSNIVILQETNILITTSPLAAGTHYNLRVSSLRNMASDILYPDPTDVSLWTPPLHLDLWRSNNTVRLDWPTGGILQHSASVTGQWLNVAGPSNSVFLTNGAEGFYRVRFP